MLVAQVLSKIRFIRTTLKEIFGRMENLVLNYGRCMFLVIDQKWEIVTTKMTKSRKDPDCGGTSLLGTKKMSETWKWEMMFLKVRFVTPWLVYFSKSFNTREISKIQVVSAESRNGRKWPKWPKMAKWPKWPKRVENGLWAEPRWRGPLRARDSWNVGGTSLLGTKRCQKPENGKWRFLRCAL